MGFFNSGGFWLAEGLLLCLSVIGFKRWAEDRGIPMSLWKWVLVLSWAFFAGFTIAFVGTCIGEGEPDAAFIGAIMFGVIATVSAVVLWRLLQVGAKPQKPKLDEEN